MVYGELIETKMNEISFIGGGEQEGSRWAELALNQTVLSMVQVIFNVMPVVLLMVEELF